MFCLYFYRCFLYVCIQYFVILTMSTLSSTSSLRCTCKYSPDSFCYVCGEYMVEKQRCNISNFVKDAYNAYFKIKLGDQDKPWAPHKVCTTCRETFRKWTQGERYMKFIVPMVWREPTDHVNDCYFCLFSLKGKRYKKSFKNSLVYPNLKSAIRPIVSIEGVSHPVFTDTVTDSEYTSVEETDDEDFQQDVSQKFNQGEINDLVRDLGLSKQQSMVLASRLKSKAVNFNKQNFKSFILSLKRFMPIF